MTAFAQYANVENRATGHDRAGLNRHLAGWYGGINVQSDHSINAFQHAVLDHSARTSLAFLIVIFFSRLQQHAYLAGQCLLRQELGSSKRTETWASCPQACMTPAMRDLYGTSFASDRGKASISARIATIRSPPPNSPTTPVRATPFLQQSQVYSAPLPPRLQSPFPQS